MANIPLEKPVPPFLPETPKIPVAPLTPNHNTPPFTQESGQTPRDVLQNLADKKATVNKLIEKIKGL